MRRILFLVFLHLSLIASLLQAELVELTILPNEYPDASSASVFVDASLLGDDEVTTSLSGRITVDLLPTALNPDTVQIVAFEGVVDDEVDFEVGGGFLLPRVTVSADPGTIRVSMVEPGESGVLESDRFSQLENLVAFEGVIEASVEPGTFDLSEQDPTSIDFEEIEFSQDGLDFELTGALETIQQIPVDVGPLTVNVEIEIDGLLSARGTRPPATYTILATQDRNDFDDTAQWLRNDIAGTNSVPLSIDAVVLEGRSDELSQVSLSDRTWPVASVLVTDNVSLSLGELSVEQELTVEDGSTLSLLDDVQVTADSLTVQAGGALLLGVGSPHTINGTFAAEGLLSVVDNQQEPGTFLVLNAGEIENGAALQATFTESEEFPGGVHLGDGLFGRVLVAATLIEVVNTQARPGDADGSGTIDFSDFLTLSTNFGTMGGSWTTGDFDGDGSVLFPDFLALSTNFGQANAALSESIRPVPEPSFASLAIVILLGGYLAQRRGRDWL